MPVPRDVVYYKFTDHVTYSFDHPSPTAVGRLHREVTAERRHREADALLQVKDVLPLSQAQLDQANQASILSLAISYMRLRDMMDSAGTNYGEWVGHHCLDCHFVYVCEGGSLTPVCGPLCECRCS